MTVDTAQALGAYTLALQVTYDYLPGNAILLDPYGVPTADPVASGVLSIIASYTPRSLLLYRKGGAGYVVDYVSESITRQALYLEIGNHFEVDPSGLGDLATPTIASVIGYVRAAVSHRPSATNPSLDDVASALAEVTALVSAVVEWQGLRELYPTGYRGAKISLPAQARVARLSLSSPLDVLASLPTEIVGGTGLIALIAFAKHLLTLPMQVSAEWSKHRLEKAKYEHERRQLEESSPKPVEVGRPSGAYKAVTARLYDTQTGDTIAEGERGAA
jgi:hypothetical protein